jgi:hypothetical protein
MPDLTGASTPIDIAPGGYQLQAPGLVGSVKEIDAQVSATVTDELNKDLVHLENADITQRLFPAESGDALP